MFLIDGVALLIDSSLSCSYGNTVKQVSSTRTLSENGGDRDERQKQAELLTLMLDLL